MDQTTFVKRPLHQNLFVSLIFCHQNGDSLSLLTHSYADSFGLFANYALGKQKFLRFSPEALCAIENSGNSYQGCRPLTSQEAYVAYPSVARCPI